MDAKKGFGLAALAAVVALGLAFASCDSGSGAGAVVDERFEGIWIYDVDPENHWVVISGNVLRSYLSGELLFSWTFTLSNGTMNVYDPVYGEYVVLFVFSNNNNTLTLIFTYGYSVLHRQL